jgi:hypothetical protein
VTFKHEAASAFSRFPVRLSIFIAHRSHSTPGRRAFFNGWCAPAHSVHNNTHLVCSMNPDVHAWQSHSKPFINCYTNCKGFPLERAVRWAIDLPGVGSVITDSSVRSTRF